MTRAVLRWLPATAIYAAISWFSHQPSWPSAVVGFPDWLLHGAAYSTLGATIWYGFGGDRGQPLPARRVLAALVLAAVAGGLDEYHQGFIEGRDAALGDVIADAVGAAIAIGLVQWAAFAGTRRAWENRPE